MLHNFLGRMHDDPDTFNFWAYFKDNYANKAINWAYCYRLHSGLNTNMHAERMHRTIKYIYLHSKHVKRLDITINALMKFIRDKLFDRLIILNKGKISSKIKELRKRHKTSMDLDPLLVTKCDNNWQVPSSRSLEAYTIYKNDMECSCEIVCTDCETCIHRFSCSCLDSSVSWNMCKHIHLLCRHLQQLQKSEEESLPEEGNFLVILHNIKLISKILGKSIITNYRKGFILFYSGYKPFVVYNLNLF